jgi:hypothetical protein
MPPVQLDPAALTPSELSARVVRLMTTLGERLTHFDRELLREAVRRAGERDGVVEALLDRNLQWAPQLERNRLLEEVAEAALAFRQGDRDAGRRLGAALGRPHRAPNPGRSWLAPEAVMLGERPPALGTARRSRRAGAPAACGGYAGGGAGGRRAGGAAETGVNPLDRALAAGNGRPAGQRGGQCCGHAHARPLGGPLSRPRPREATCLRGHRSPVGHACGSTLSSALAGGLEAPPTA